MNTKQLRQKILDLAIRGQLVPQDNNDEPASVLLEKIRAEKQTLIEQKKIKKDKKSSYITCDLSPYQKYTEHFADGSSKDITDEIPFDIPENWAWCRLGTLLINRNGERKPLSSSVRSKQNEKKYDYYGATGVIDKVDSYIFSEKLLLVGEDGANLLSKIKPNAFFAEGKYWVNNHAHILDATDKSLLDYVIVVINSISLDNYITGSAQPKLSQERLNKILLPLPPLSEQRRIVEKIEELLALVDDLETNKTDLQSYIKQAKSKVLEMAVRGELVLQNPEDEPASALLERIKKEQKSSKSKGKTTAHNTHYEEELPFNIPENWVWCRLGEITKIIQYGVSKSAKSEGLYRLLRITDIQYNKVIWENVPFTDIKEKDAENFILENGDFLFARTGATVGKSYLVEDLVEKSVFASYLIRISLLPNNNINYIKFFFNSEFYWQQISEKSIGIGQPNVNGTSLKKLFLPLPPLAEQHRIVEKIEHIFAVLEELEENIL